MEIYLGNSGKLKLILNNVKYRLYIVDGTMLSDNEDCVLQDANGRYLLARGGE